MIEYSKVYLGEHIDALITQASLDAQRTLQPGSCYEILFNSLSDDRAWSNGAGASSVKRRVAWYSREGMEHGVSKKPVFEKRRSVYVIKQRTLP